MAIFGSTNSQFFPAFQFLVNIQGIGKIGFSSIKGLESETKTIEIEEMTGLEGPTLLLDTSPVKKVTLSKAYASHNGTSLIYDLELWKERASLRYQQRSFKRDVYIQIFSYEALDDAANSPNIFMLTNAFPTKITYSDLEANESKIIDVQVELTYDSLVLQTTLLR